MSELPKSVKSRLQQLAVTPVGPQHELHPDAHPDTEALSAFMEQAVGERERAQILAHLSVCGKCREVVALALPEQEEQDVTAAAESARGWFRLPSDLMRWGGVAASAAVVVIAVLAVRNELVMQKPLPQPVKVGPVMSGRLEGPAASTEAKPATGPTGQGAAEADATADHRLKIDTGAKPNRLTRAKESTAEELHDRMMFSKTVAPAEGAGLAAVGGVRSGMGSGTASGVGSGTARGVGSGAGRELGLGAPMAPANQPRQVVEGEAAITEFKLQEQAKAEAVPSKKMVAPGPRADFASLDASKDEKSKGEVAAFGKVEPAKADSRNAELAATMNDSQSMQKQKATQGAPVTVEKPVMQTQPGASASMSRMSSTTLRVWRIFAGRLQVSTNRGKDWIDIKNMTVPQDSQLRSVDSNANGAVWAGGANGMVVHSKDHGSTWSRVEGGWAGDVVFIRFPNSQEGMLRTSSGEEWFTADGGKTWTKR